MKKALFNQFASMVAASYMLGNKKVLFQRTKRQDIVDARQMVWYLCIQRGLSLADIIRMMADSGLPLKHPAVINGIRKVEGRVNSDLDYKDFVEKIQNLVKIREEQPI